ncbi:hypothetical protein [Promicromonospora sukumoe]|uniref:hypothetical protein n=1 Tax=Promicromonospora sukumoe TaxID=88382 RepID=UPI00364C48B5
MAVHESLRALGGHQIRGVRYIDLDYGKPRPYWDEGERDLVAFGLELDLDDDSIWSVVWEQRGDNQGLGVRAEALIPAHVTTGSTWDVSRRWRRKGPARISSVQSCWWKNQATRHGAGEPATTSFELHGLALRDGADEALIMLHGVDDVTVYLNPGRSLRARVLSPELVPLGGPDAAAGEAPPAA